MSSSELNELEKRLSYTFQKQILLMQALTHKSYLNEVRDRSVQDNERFEFLGDAVLDLVMSEELLWRFPHESEGELSKMKAKLVSEVSLTKVARSLDLGRFLLLGKGEEVTQGREKSSILSDALEAVIAAVYIDGGLQNARTMVLRHFSSQISDLLRPESRGDYKTELQEFCQQEFGLLPVYRTVRESGPDHQKIFEVRIEIKGEIFGNGVGKSKKEAEQAAACTAMERLRKTKLRKSGEP
ncbi:MAG TPA: ribonuclease III [Nitrospiria bacterium]|nr:ribonuclease III [Nitrospiria bacterium]